MFFLWNVILTLFNIFRYLSDMYYLHLESSLIELMKFSTSRLNISYVCVNFRHATGYTYSQ